jgi:hypothetical protein
MATFQVQRRSAARRLDRYVAAVKPRTSLPPSSPSLAQILAHLGQRFLGATLLLLGSVLVFTLVLMPVGLPLVLLGVALIAEPSNF